MGGQRSGSIVSEGTAVKALDVGGSHVGWRSGSLARPARTRSLDGVGGVRRYPAATTGEVRVTTAISRESRATHVESEKRAAGKQDPGRRPGRDGEGRAIGQGYGLGCQMRTSWQRV